MAEQLIKIIAAVTMKIRLIAPLTRRLSSLPWRLTDRAAEAARSDRSYFSIIDTAASELRRVEAGKAATSSRSRSEEYFRDHEVSHASVFGTP
jgi:hypothetical protein